MGNKYIILPKKEYLKYLFSLIIVLNGISLSILLKKVGLMNQAPT